MKLKYLVLLLLYGLSTQTNLAQKLELKAMMGHNRGIVSLALSPNDKIIATGGLDNDIILWDFENGRELKKLTGHTGDVESLCFTSNSLTLVSAGADRTIRLWDVSTGILLQTLTGHQNAVNQVLVSLDDQFILSGSADQSIRIWDRKTGNALKTLTGHSSQVRALDLSKDGKYLISGDQSGNIKIWNLESGAEIRSIKTNQLSINSVKFHPVKPGVFLTAGGSGFSEKGELKVWHSDSSKALVVFKDIRAEVYDAFFSPDGKNIFSAGGSELKTELKYWNVGNQVLVKDFSGSKNKVTAVALHSSGLYLVSGGGLNQDNSAELYIWEVEKGSIARSMKGNVSGLTALAFSPDDKYLACSFLDNSIKIWELDSLKVKQVLIAHTKKINQLLFSADGKTLYSCSDDATATAWNVTDGSILLRLQESSAIKNISLDKSQRLLATASSGAVKIWNLETVEVSAYLRKFEGLYVNSMAYLQDYKQLLVGGNDFGLKSWNIANGLEASTYLPATIKVNDACTGMDGKQIAAVDESGLIKIFDALSKILLKSFKVEGSPANQLLYFRVAPNAPEKYLAVVGLDPTIKVWDAVSGLLWKSLKGHSGEISALTGSKNGKWLASGSADGIVKLWHAAQGVEVISLVNEKGNSLRHLKINPEGLYAGDTELSKSIYFINHQETKELDKNNYRDTLFLQK